VCPRAADAKHHSLPPSTAPTLWPAPHRLLQALHNVGIVHRDIKPANIVFDESARRFRLIDLGAAACLRTGTNYKPAETILDPCYCPPEEVRCFTNA
jgi:serine/threonine protein kinase